MKKLKKLADKIFSFKHEKDSSGLFVTVDDLIEQRQKAAYLRMLNAKLPTSRQAGDVKSAFKGRGIEMEEIRSYSFGDDVRDIDWRVTARKSSPYTKVYNEEKDREIYVVLDLSPYMAFGTRKELKTVAAAKIAALLAWSSLTNKDRFGCVIFDGKSQYIFKPRNHQGAVVAIFKKIAELSKVVLNVKENDEDGLAKALKLLKKNVKGQAAIFVVSDFSRFGDDVKKSLAALSSNTSVYLINVFDVLEDVAPKAGEYMAEDNGKRVVFDSSSKLFQKEYRHYFAEKRQQVRDFGRRFSCRYMEVRTDTDLHRQLKF